MRPDGFADLQTIGIRQHDVQNDQVGLFTAAQVDSAFSGSGSGEYEAFLLEVVLDQRVGVASSSMSTIFHSLFHQSHPKVTHNLLQTDYEGLTLLNNGCIRQSPYRESGG